MRSLPGWRVPALLLVLLIAAFVVPIAGPLRSSGEHMLIAAGILLAGVGIAMLATLPGKL